ncbi:KR domain-containing protein [Xenorhabdus bovienii]|nr:KR domain-containing protein [Xenorhabdus bovienii]
MPDIQTKKSALQALITARQQQIHPQREQQSVSASSHSPQAIAIIGMAGMFPQSEDKTQFWQHLSQTHSLIELWPDSRPTQPESGDEPLWGGFMPDVSGFDPAFFRLPQGEATLMDPQLRKLLMCAYHSIEDAGYAPESLRGSRTGVYIAFESNEYGQLLEEQRCNIGSGLYQSASIVANYLSWMFDFQGPSDVINAMCASGAVAIDRAISALRQGEIESAIVGSANIMLRPETFATLRESGQLTSRDRVCSFGAEAEGYLRGEGVTSLVLKPLQCAIADRDHIYATIKHSVTGFNGRGGTSIAAPDIKVHAQLMQRCWREAGVQPTDIGMIEVQGMGNPLADMAEWEACNQALTTEATRQGQALTPGSCAVGTLKPVTGHMHASATAGAIFKIVHCLQSQTILPVVGLSEIGSSISTADRPCWLPQLPQLWASGTRPRIASIHAWGSGGNIAHVVLEEYCPPRSALTSDSATYCLLPFSAPDGNRLRKLVLQTYDTLARQPHIRLMDVAFTLQHGRTLYAQRLLFVSRDLQHWLEQAQAWLEAPEYNLPAGVFTAEQKEAATCPPAGKNWLGAESSHWMLSEKAAARFFTLPEDGVRVPLPGMPFLNQPYWLPGKSRTPDLPVEDDKRIAGAVKTTLADYLGVAVDALNLQTDFSELGFNSLMVSNLTARLRQEHQLEIPASMLFACRTPQALISALRAPRQAQSAERPRRSKREEDEIAVIGIAGNYPDAEDLEAFWNNLAAGNCAVCEVPPQRWSADSFYCADKKAAAEQGKSYGKWGAFLEQLNSFDAAFFNISPNEARFMHPKERLFMQVAWHALEDACYTPQSLGGQRVGVFVGVSKAGLDNYQDSFFSIANRVSYKFNFTGISMPVDTACSSSLTAVHEACLHLRNGDCDVALVGAVNAYTHPSTFIAFSSLQVLSPNGRCAAFGAEANGFVPGEGAGALLLKPLSAARRDGDRIHAIIRGSAVNHGGKANGYTVPNPDAQQQLIVQAMAEAGVNAADISYVEAHGTGTVLGDPVEVRGLTAAFNQRGGRELPCILGSLKPNIGHLEAAAGLAGLTKVILQMRHRQWAPSLHADQLNPEIDFASAPFSLVRELTPWTVAEGQARIAAVSSFGAGGSNAHVIVAEGEAAHASPPPERPLLFLFSARSAVALQRYVSRYIDFLTRGEQSLTDIAYTLLTGRESMEFRLAIIAQDRKQLIASLSGFNDGSRDEYTFYRTPRNGASLTSTLFSQNGEAKALLQRWFEQGDFTWLAQLWAEGCEIDLAAAATGMGGGQRISLPLYPFEMKTFTAAPCVWPQAQPSETLRVRAGDESMQSYRPIWRAEEITSAPALQQGESVCFGLGVERHLATEMITLPNAEGVTESERFISLCQATIAALQKIMRSSPVPTRLQLLCHSVHFPWSSALLALLRTAQQEWPRLAIQLIELESCAIPELAARIQADREQMTQQHIRYRRSGQREIRVWQPVALPGTVGSARWRDGGSYLITGGLGSIGQALADMILTHCPQSQLYLLGRSAADAAQQLWLDKWRARGASLSVFQGDISNKEALCQVKRQMRNDGVSTLTGIFHCAGVIRDALLAHKTPQQVAEVCAAKVDGTVNLDEIFADDELDFFVCFSSASAVAGRQAQADYAAANAFMDDYVQVRRQQVERGERHGQSLSLNWGLWDSEGMCLPADTVSQLWQQTGMQPIAVPFGLATLSRLLDAPNVAGQWLLIQGNAARMEAHLRKLGVLDAPTPQPPLQDSWLKQQIADLLNVAQQAVDEHLTFEEMGFTRNEYQQLQAAITQRWGVGALSLETLSECTDLHQLTGLLNARATDGTPAATMTFQKLLQLVISAFAEITGLAAGRIDPDAHMEKYGLDSLLIARINDRLEQSLGPLPATLLYEYPTITALAQGLLEQYALQRQALPQNATRHPDASASASVAPLPASEAETANKDIAIIGLAGRYPQANNLEEFWQVLSQGKDCISEIPADRWDVDQYFAAQPQTRGKTYARWGGFINDVDKFDAQFFNISPKEAQHIEPQERLFLQCAYETIQDAGYTPAALNQQNGKPAQVGVFVGVTFQEYQLHGVEQAQRGNPLVLSMSSASIANRVSWFGNFSGPSMAVDTMCASSLSSIHLACQSLWCGESQVALAGGVNISIHPAKYLMLGHGGFASPTGRCHSFGAEADGYVPGEGVGAVLLKPLAQAHKDGDHIYGVIKASVVNHGGRTHGYNVPNPQAQTALIHQALIQADIAPDCIGYLEAHGTGTPLGDPIEIRALDQAWRQAGHQQAGCAIGSVKSNIGHCESAAGIAGLTKVLLQFRHRQLVPSLHTERLNPNIDFSSSWFHVQRELSEWRQHDSDTPLTAGVSSFGAGGANAHLIVSAPPATESKPATTPLGQWLLPLSARTPEQLRESVMRLQHWLAVEQPNDTQLNSIAWTLQMGREEMCCRLGIVIDSVFSLAMKLQRWLTGEALDADMLYRELEQSPVSGNEHYKTDRSTSLHHLLALWCAGQSIDWTSYYASGTPLRISLPGYPFAKKRCWFNAVSAVPASTQPAAHGTQRDKAGKIILTPLPDAGQQQAADSSVTQKNAPRTESIPSVSVITEAANVPDDLLIQLKESLGRALYLSPEEISSHRRFTDLGLDSIIGVEWIRDINQTLGLSLPANTVYQYDTLLDFARFISQPQTQKPRTAQPASDATCGDALMEPLRASLADALYLEPEEIAATRKFTDLGLDSIIGVEWIRDINRRYHINLPVNVVYQYPTLTKFAAHLEQQIAQNSTLNLDQILEQVKQGSLEPEAGEALLQNVLASM